MDEKIYYVLVMLGILADSLIVFVIASNKKLKTSANLILMNWSIINLLVLISSIVNILSVLTMVGFSIDLRSGLCMLVEIHAVLQISSNIFVLALISTTVQNSMKMNLPNLIVYYAVMLGALIVSIVLCYLNPYAKFLSLAAAVIYLTLLLTMISKEVCLLCKWRTVTPNKEKLVRFNVARIYTYFRLAYYVCNTLVEPGLEIEVMLRMVIEFVYVSDYVSSVYVIVYLSIADRKFQTCLLNMFRRKEDPNRVDVTLGTSQKDGGDEIDVESGATNDNNRMNTPG